MNVKGLIDSPVEGWLCTSLVGLEGWNQEWRLTAPSVHGGQQLPSQCSRAGVYCKPMMNASHPIKSILRRFHSSDARFEEV